VQEESACRGASSQRTQGAERSLKKQILGLHLALTAIHCAARSMLVSGTLPLTCAFRSPQQWLRLSRCLAPAHPWQPAISCATKEPACWPDGANPTPTASTLMNIADAVRARLQATETHRRSMHSATTVWLEAAPMPTRLAASERLACAMERRTAVPQRRFLVDGIDQAKREGRP
jgi:hypothetical protein